VRLTVLFYVFQASTYLVFGVGVLVESLKERWKVGARKHDACAKANGSIRLSPVISIETDYSQRRLESFRSGPTRPYVKRHLQSVAGPVDGTQQVITGQISPTILRRAKSARLDCNQSLCHVAGSEGGPGASHRR